MQIDCPSCRKSYHIIDAVLGSAGRHVVCPCCDAIWFVAADAHAAVGAATDQALSTLPKIAITTADRNPHRAEPAALSYPSVPERRLRRALTNICAGAALVVLMMIVIGARAEIVRLWPRAATAYAALGLAVNLHGLALENFHTVVTNDGLQTVLGIEGKIENLRPRATKIPSIQLAIRDKNGHILYSWQVAAPQQSLAAHATFTFRARLAAPPAAGAAVLVRFTPVTSWSLVVRPSHLHPRMTG